MPASYHDDTIHVTPSLTREVADQDGEWKAWGMRLNYAYMFWGFCLGVGALAAMDHHPWWVYVACFLSGPLPLTIIEPAGRRADPPAP